MVKITKIYTKTGDDGTTGLVGGERTMKDSLRVSAYGTVDELNAAIGWARTVTTHQTLIGQLSMIQNELFDIGSELATPPHSTWPGQKTIGADHITRLETWIDEAVTNLPELRSFVLPGGTVANAALHLARTICRRAEREVLRLSRQEEVRSSVLHYLNRLSDLLFAMAREASRSEGAAEYLWVPGGASAS